jgi:hypothetical protein
MYIEFVPNRNSRPAILLRESYREGTRVRKRTIANLSDWPEELIDALRSLLKMRSVGGAHQRRPAGAGAAAGGEVDAVLGALRDIGLERMVASAGHRPRDTVVAKVVVRLIESLRAGPARRRMRVLEGHLTDARGSATRVGRSPDDDVNGRGRRRSSAGRLVDR